jgi:subtilisin family serine protease
VRIAIIDSGADVTHRNLRHVKQGVDVPRGDGDGWKQDPIGHGTHCAGIIAAGHADGFGIRGIAPEAELHILKVMPEGHVDDLIKALQYCMQNDTDIVCCGIGAVGAPNSAIAALLEPFFIKAREMGIACIVPAGNTATPVQYPACSPNVLTVAAVGRFSEFPADSYHTTVAIPPASPEGIFLTRYSCWGPEIGLAGPGVAVVSTVPENAFAAWDGTSMAASHVAGLAALVLAHNLDFQTTFAGRNAARVDHLFNVLVQSAQPIALGDRMRVGASLPNAVAALQPWAGVLPSMAFTPDQQAEVARRVAEAVQNALSPAVARSIASMMGASAPSSQPPGDLGLAAVWPFPPRG